MLFALFSLACQDSKDAVDTAVDETGECLSTWYIDSDGDGFGSAEQTLESCFGEAGWVENDDDCDDADPETFPEGPEVCNGVDDDCDGLIDDEDEDVSGGTTWYADTDGDGFGDPDSAVVLCDPPSNYIDLGGDCDDTRDDVNPDAEEFWDDGVDSD